MGMNLGVRWSRWMLVLLAAALSLVAAACGGGGGGGNDDDDDDTSPTDDDDDDDDQPNLTEEAAEEVAVNAVEQIQFQQNTENMANVDQYVPQGLRGKIGRVVEAIVIPGEVPCQSLEIDLQEQVIEATITYDGDCVIEGVTYSGSMAMRMEGDEQNFTMDIAFDDYTVDGVVSNGEMSLSAQTTTEGSTISMTFDGMTTEDGTLDGSMTISASADGHFTRAEFQDFNAGGESMDGYYEVTVNDADSVTVDMDLSGTGAEGSFDADYAYTMTNLGGGRLQFVGEGNFSGDGLGGTVAMSYDFILAPFECGDIPQSGTMTLDDGTQTAEVTFNCTDATAVLVE